VAADGRPDFLVKLGVLLPCTPEDVKQAYLAKVKSVHPDEGGTQADFLELQEAFERATEYAQFLSGRRKWLAVQIERYVEQEAAIEHLRAEQGQVTLEHKHWLSREIGKDFAQVLDVISAVRWNGPQVGDEQIDWMLQRVALFNALRRLDLSGSRLTDQAVTRLDAFSNLEHLDLRDTPITHRGLQVLDKLPNLGYLNLRGTRIGAMRVVLLRRAHPQIEIEH
jgi:hypothetical protein